MNEKISPNGIAEIFLFRNLQLTGQPILQYLGDREVNFCHVRIHFFKT